MNTDLPKILHYVGDGDTALCDGRSVDYPPRGWAAITNLVSCEDCLRVMATGPAPPPEVPGEG